eukprot:2898721-Amphidinium_carterae.4
MNFPVNGRTPGGLPEEAAGRVGHNAGHLPRFAEGKDLLNQGLRRLTLPTCRQWLGASSAASVTGRLQENDSLPCISEYVKQSGSCVRAREIDKCDCGLIVQVCPESVQGQRAEASTFEVAGEASLITKDFHEERRKRIDIQQIHAGVR